MRTALEIIHEIQRATRVELGVRETYQRALAAEQASARLHTLACARVHELRAELEKLIQEGAQLQAVQAMEPPPLTEGFSASYVGTTRDEAPRREWTAAGVSPGRGHDGKGES